MCWWVWKILDRFEVSRKMEVTLSRRWRERIQQPCSEMAFPLGSSGVFEIFLLLSKMWSLSKTNFKLPTQKICFMSRHLLTLDEIVKWRRTLSLTPPSNHKHRVLRVDSPTENLPVNSFTVSPGNTLQEIQGFPWTTIPKTFGYSSTFQLTKEYTSKYKQK